MPTCGRTIFASPPLVVAYALAGSMYSDLLKQPLGLDKKGKKVFLKDIGRPTARSAAWCARPSPSRCSRRNTRNVFKGDAHWRGIK